MLTNFEQITIELTEEEMKVLPLLVNGFKNRTKANPIKAPEIVRAMNDYMNGSYRMTEVKLRKFCNYIRSNGLIPLIATSEGYYCSNDREEIQKQITSLEERARSIQRCADGMKLLLTGWRYA